MRNLTQSERDAFVAALERREYNKSEFRAAMATLNNGVLEVPDLGRPAPSNLVEWRYDAPWSIAFVDRYMRAVAAASKAADKAHKEAFQAEMRGANTGPAEA